MRKAWVMVSALALTASAGHAAYTVAPYTGSTWTKTWDFNDGGQGWTGTTAGSGQAFWAATGDANSTNVTNGAWFTSSPGTGNNGFATFNLASLGGDLANLGTPTIGGHKGFVLQADILIPVYTGAGSVGGAHPGVLQGQTIGAVRTGDSKGPAIGGGVGSSYGAQGKDRAWDNTNRTLGFTFGKSGAIHTNTWMKLQVDYGYTDPTHWNAWVYNPLSNDRDPAGGWMQVVTGSGSVAQTNGSGDLFQLLTLGGNGSNGQTAFGNSFIDNVRLLVPEPTSLGLLGLGGLLLSRRRRMA